MLVEKVELIVGMFLVGRETGRRRVAGFQRLLDIVRHGRRHVGVNAEQSRRRQQGHLLRDRIAPIAALRHVLRVAEALHQHDPGACDANRIPAGPVGLPENPWPGNDGITTSNASDALPPCAVGLVSGSMIFICSMIEPGQPCVTMIGSAFALFRTNVDEMNVQPVDLRDELRQGVQPRFDLAPVVTPSANSARVPHRRELHALRCIRYDFPRRPLRRGDPPAQVRQRLIGRMEPERADCAVFRRSRRFFSLVRWLAGQHVRRSCHGEMRGQDAGGAHGRRSGKQATSGGR